MILWEFWTLLFLICTYDSNADESKIKMQCARYDDIQQKYDDHNESIVLFSREVTLLQQTIDVIKNNTCKIQSQSVLINLHNLTGWAVKFYDASGKIPMGILAGSVYQLGNFDECLDLGLDDDRIPTDVRGQYCLGEVEVEVPEVYLSQDGSIWEAFRDTKKRYREPIKKLYWGICVPAKCMAEDIENVIRKILAVPFNNTGLKLTVKIPETSCYKNESEALNTPNIIFMSIILFVFTMICGSTIFHVFLLKQNKVPSRTLTKIIISFSLILNLKKLFGPAHISNLHLDYISGIKTLSMVFILFGHSLVFITGGPVFNKNFNEEAITKIENSIFLNGPLLVDTFLLLSGFLFCRILLQELDKTKSVNFLLLYIARYIRLTPAYLVIIGIYALLLTQLGRGPFWSIMRHEQQKCLASWWTNILYINNYINTDKLCMFQSWYLSVDTQLFVLAPMIIYPLWRWRKIGEYLLIGAIMISMAIQFIITFLDNLDPTLMIYSREIKDITKNDFFINTYIKTHMRAEPYCIGLACGYIIYRIYIDEYQLPKKIVKFGWLLAIVSLLASLFSITIFYNIRKDYTAIEAAIYSPLHRLFWCMGISWILIASITDNAGPVKNFLKHRLFVVISRLTYSAYLVNGLVELYSAATLRSPYYLDNFQLLFIIVSHTVLTFGGAIILSTMFESPILALERIFLRNEK